MRLIVTTLCMLAGMAHAGMPTPSPDVLAKSCAAVLVVQATNREDTIDFQVTEIWRGNIATNPLPQEVRTSLSRLEDGDRAIVFIRVVSVMSRPSTISGLRVIVPSVARINGDTVQYLGPRPGQVSTGKEITEFSLTEFRQLVSKKEQPTKESTVPK